jgi:iron complex outermembrane receptor protein
VFPDNHNLSRSETTQVVLAIDHDFFDLPGGALNVAVSGQYRYEAIHNPSANAPNNVDPTQRYFSVNAVGVDGSRRVWSGAFEISAPISDMLRVKIDGSYDHYSTGQSKFSPKFEAEFKPIEQLKLRGTYSKGFRIPSFAEAFALPTTGYVNSNINCNNATFTAFCAAHASNPNYYQGGYSYGLTSAGNSSLSPEKAESFTLGAVFEPKHHIIFTVDYWQTKISNVIVPTQVTQDIINQYYTNNGVVNVPGITVVPGTPDAQNLNALPLLGFVVGTYNNADSYLARGIDFQASSKVRVTNSINWNSTLHASLLLKLSQTLKDGTYQRYDGSLGACNITACSGAPHWRLVWGNTFDFNDKVKLTLTGYFTEGYGEYATDSGGVYGDCQASADSGSILAWDNGDPVLCRAKSSFDLDGHIEYKIDSRFTIYGDVLNILNTGPHFEPNAAYGLYGFNPSWEDKQFIGRWFRIGVKVDM